jgi:hypothetical protein
MASSPSAALPVAISDDAELEGAYRMTRSEFLAVEGLFGAHAEGTRKRVEKEPGVVLVVHDTTTCSFPDLPGQEVGYLQTGKPGFLLHLALAIEAKSRRPLGVIHTENLVRKQRAKRAWRKTRPSGVETTATKDREYLRWSRGLKATASLRANREIIHVADRESDSFELMAEAVGRGQSFIFRVRTDRRGRLPDDEAWSHVKEIASSCEGVLEREVPVSRRTKKSAPRQNRDHPARPPRTATLRFASTSVVIPRPQYLHDPLPRQLELNIVHVVEVDAPTGQEPIEWFLYTTEPVDTVEAIEFVVDAYRARWTIEEFFAALKTGCAYEARQSESLHALLVLLALSLPIACEVLWLRSVARHSSEAPASTVVTPLQLRVLRALSHRPPPAKATVKQALIAVAALGGHIKGNGDPGWAVLSRGMAKLFAFEAGWTAAEKSARRRQKM